MRRVLRSWHGMPAVGKSLYMVLRYRSPCKPHLLSAGFYLSTKFRCIDMTGVFGNAAKQPTIRSRPLAPCSMSSTAS